MTEPSPTANGPSAVRVVVTDEEVLACVPVLKQLRPALVEGEFLRRFRDLQVRSGYRLAYIGEERVAAVAGFRFGDWLHSGEYLEIEELVTDESARSSGLGGVLLNWLVSVARDCGCNEVRLVSGVKRIDAHRFYRRHGLRDEGLYFSMKC